ncbi:uncharacterized protein LOC114335442 [Diabrotica virgifera virgifera]|uniref:Ionotropic glutamate receptor C-terminal domain-containing protein n=1 Tax=Diabrotica virgifera virgifera TaxID=50390 RepID=A0ABM5JQD6_DIAVI|nr:uncharacterized protein LOC114335442 [Diabrotica virgifera virgifera]
MENDVGEWDVRDGFSRYNQLILSTNRSNIMGVNLNISYVVTNNDTFNHLEDFRDRHIDPISKVNWFVMRNLLLLLNGTSTPIFQSTWGYRDGNTSRYTGMVGDLKSGEAEIGGTAAFFTIDRIDIIEYIAPSAPTHIRFLFRAPPLSYVSNVFTLPFDSYVWYCCFGLIPLVFIAVYIIVKWEWYDPVFKETVAETHSNTIMPLRPGFFDVLVMELGAITQQGTDTEPKSVSGRIATVFTFIAFMFLYTAYAANIVAILQSTTESIKTLEDLLHSRISLGVEDIVYAHYYFQTAEEPVRKAIYHQKVAPKGQKANFMDIYEGISKVQKGFFAFHVELSSGYKVIADTFQENEKCGLKTIEFMNMLEPWVSIRKRSAYKEVIKVGLRKILEVGVQRRDVNRFYSNKPVCQNKGSNFGSAGLVDCYAAFLIYGIGIIFSVFLMVIEILVQKRLRKRKSSAQSDVYVSPVEEYLYKETHLFFYRNIHIDAISKLNWIIVGLLLSTLNASSTNIFQPTWGYREGNSTIYSGMIGDLQTNRAEIGGTASFFTLDRLDVIEYVAPSAPTFMKFIFKAPPLSYVSNVFTLPFDTYVWYCCFALVPIIFIAVFIIVKWEWKDPVFKLKVEETHSNSITPLRPGLFDILVMELGAITQQGSDTEPKSNAGRAAIVFTFIAFMFLYTAYSANIVALLQSTTESIKTLEDLLHSRINLGVEDIVYAHYYFKTADEPTRKAIYQQKVAPKGQKPNFFTKEEGIARVQKEFFGFHIELSTGYKVIADTFNENEKCGLKEIEFIKLLEPWLSIKKNSAYKEVIKVGLRKILESGLQRRNTNRLYLKKPVCHSKGSNFGSAGIIDCYAAFLIFGIGIVLSILFCLAELIVQHKFQK